MANKTVHLPLVPAEALGGTLRKDAWWVGPAADRPRSARASSSTRRSAPSRERLYEWRAYLSPFYSPFFDVSWAKGMGLGLLHAGHAHPAGPRELPLHLLLLPQGLLPRVRVGPARLRRRRAQRATGTTARRSSSSSRTCTATRCTWRSSSSSSSGRTRSSAVIGWKDGVHVGRRARSSCSPTCIAAHRLHLRLPQLPAPRRRRREQLLDGRASAASATRLWKLVTRAQRAAHALRVGEPLLASR